MISVIRDRVTSLTWVRRLFMTDIKITLDLIVYQDALRMHSD